MATLSACKEDVRWYNKVTGKKFVISTKNIIVRVEIRWDEQKETSGGQDEEKAGEAGI